MVLTYRWHSADCAIEVVNSATRVLCLPTVTQKYKLKPGSEKQWREARTEHDIKP
jgi:hypothetical protein